MLDTGEDMTNYEFPLLTKQNVLAGARESGLWIESKTATELQLLSAAERATMTKKLVIRLSATAKVDPETGKIHYVINLFKVKLKVR